MKEMGGRGGGAVIPQANIRIHTTMNVTTTFSQIHNTNTKGAKTFAPSAPFAVGGSYELK